MTLVDLIKQRKALEKEAAMVKAALAEVDEQIDGILVEQVAAGLAAKGTDTGTVNLTRDGVDVKAVVSKSVDWDQSKLAEIWTSIQAANDDPAQYIGLKYSVSETSFKAWPESIKRVFYPARTLKPGKPKYTFGELPEECEAA